MHGTPLPAGLLESAPAPRAGLHPLDEGDRGPRREHLLRRRRPISSAPSVAERAARDLPRRLQPRAPRSPSSAGSSSPTPSSSSGFIDGELAICDEILTPDSSRFWPAEPGSPGRRRPRSTSSRCATGPRRRAGTRHPRRPRCPREVVAATRERYVRPTSGSAGRSFADWWGA